MNRKRGTTGTKMHADGYTFDSAGEYRHYCNLLLRSRSEIDPITGLVVHPKFTLLDKFERHGLKYKPLTYTADFMYQEYDPDGHPLPYLTVDDVKGFTWNKRTGNREPLVTPEWEVRWKLVAYLFPGKKFNVVEA